MIASVGGELQRHECKPTKSESSGASVQLLMLAVNWDCFPFLSCQDFFLAWFPDTIYIYIVICWVSIRDKVLIFPKI